MDQNSFYTNLTEAITTEDKNYFLKMWKASSRREIIALLKERGEDIFSPELMKKACKYLFPSERDDLHYNMIMKSMPKIDIFLKSFGKWMDLFPDQRDRLSLVLLYRASLSKNKKEVYEILEKTRSVFKNTLITRPSIKINDLYMDDIRMNIYSIVIGECQKDIVSSGASDNIGRKFDVFFSEMKKLASLVGGGDWWEFMYYKPAKSFSLKDKIKYLVALVSNKYPNYQYAIDKLAEYLEDAGVRFYEEMGRDDGIHTRVIVVPKYDKLFPSSKQLIDKWYAGKDIGLLTFGEVDPSSVFGTSMYLKHNNESGEYEIKSFKHYLNEATRKYER